MAAPKNKGQLRDNDFMKLKKRCEEEFRSYIREYQEKHGSIPEWAAELLKKKAFDHIAMLTRTGMMALLPMDKGRPNLSIAVVAFGTAAKYTHVELTRPEQQTNIGQVFVAIKQFSEQPKKLEGPKVVEAEVVD